MSYVPLGEKIPGKGYLSKEGYQVSCTCGWTDGPLRLARDCGTEYASHVARQRDRVCVECSAVVDKDQLPSNGIWKCPDCYKASEKYRRDRFRELDPIAKSLAARRSTLKSKYGLLPEDVELMFLFQGGECAICHSTIHLDDKNGLHIDHCHRDGHVRGLLCSRCNWGLGNFKDDIQALQAAINYLTDKGRPPTIWIDRRDSYPEILGHVHRLRTADGIEIRVGLETVDFIPHRKADIK